MRWTSPLPLAVAVVACSADSGVVPDLVTHRGPDRAVSEMRVCSYEYDDADRLVSLVVDSEEPWDRTVTYEWDGDDLARIDIAQTFEGEVHWTLSWSNGADGSTAVETDISLDTGDTRFTTYAMDAPVALPRVLACGPLSMGRVYMGHAHPSEFGVPDRFVTRTRQGEDTYTYSYTGVDAGVPGVRVRDDGELGNYDTPMTHRYTYDERGWLVEQYFDTGEDPFSGSHVYLADGRFANDSFFHDDITLESTYVYDNGDNLVEIVCGGRPCILGTDERAAAETYEYD